ncbi:hypothetical protein N7G274_008009 [Stereocaulon virgatum]|uniref:Uncharacterized protein n=1 Tax=Stereocaulon virgatum TaxID=373712 RepID=A0ABR4A233_9LECA
MEGQHNVKTVVLIKVMEDLPYRSPVHTLREDEIKGLGFPPFRELDTSLVVLEDQADRFGKLQIRNLTWVGKMYAFLEIWKANTKTGNAERQGVRKYFVGSTDDEIAELDIKLSDLYPIDARIGDKRLPLTWERLRR